MNRSRIRPRGTALSAVGVVTAALLVAFGSPAQAAPPSASVHIPGNTPAWLASAANLGPVDSDQQMHLTVWLTLHNENKLHQQLRDLYTEGSGSYHRWLSQEQFDAAYSPTAQQVKSVANYLRGHGLVVGATAENNFYVEASGSAAAVEKAFHIGINTYRYRGKTYQANDSDPSVTSSGGGNIAFIDGLNTAAGYQPDIRRAAEAGPATSVVYDVLCGDMTTSKTVSFTDQTSQTYTGFIPCGYDGDQLQKAYGVDGLVSSGIDGSGQTVAIVDAYGSPTILQDANAFSAKAGLPLLDSSNFQVIAPPGTVHKHESRAQDPLGWQAEVTLDVEAVHAMAPGAKIVLVAAPNNYADLDEAVNWVVLHHVANIVTNSWGLSTDLMDPGQATRDERIFMQAAARGVGLDFSSGVSGDEVANTGVKSVDYPASSPWVTAVGGTSLFLNADNSYDFETGWGNDLDKLASCATSSTDPSTNLLKCSTYDKSTAESLGFQGGAGGGLSYNFTAQPWQSAAIGSETASGFGTVGTHRAVPDVSMLADPYTGMNVYITDLSAGDTTPEIEPYGGTSLASPLFAGISALVDQARAMHGKAPMGLASQWLYNLPAGAVRDVTAPPDGTGNAVTGDPDAMAQFYGSRYSGSLFNVTFNQDSSLATASGWDDVTGVGAPYAPAFVAALS
jgi:subtilase family serine protease